MTHTLGIDVSKWQNAISTPQVMDFNKAKAGGVEFVFIKASQANWIDRDMLMNWSNAKRAGLLRGAYHYMTWDVDAITQARTLLSVTRDDPPELGLVVDYERRLDAPGAGTMRAMLKGMLEYLKANTKVPIIIYTAPYFWREFGSADAYWSQYPLWLAHYTTAAAPMLVAPWKSWMFWQWTDAGPGLALGAESKELDMNWYNGSLDELRLWAGVSVPEPMLTIEQRVDRLEKWVAAHG